MMSVATRGLVLVMKRVHVADNGTATSCVERTFELVLEAVVLLQLV